MFIPINPWANYIARNELPSIYCNFKNDKKYLKETGIVTLICVIITIVIWILSHSVNYRYGTIVAIIILAPTSLIFTIMWFRDLFKWKKKIKTDNPDVKKVISIERYYYVSYKNFEGDIYNKIVKLEPGERANKETFDIKLLGNSNWGIISWSLIEN